MSFFYPLLFPPLCHLPLPVGFLCWCHVGFQSECCHLTCLVLPWRPWLVSWWTSMAVVVWTSVWDIYFCGIHFLFIFIHHGQTLSSRSETTHWMFYTPLKGEKRAIWRRAELDRGCVCEATLSQCVCWQEEALLLRVCWCSSVWRREEYIFLKYSVLVSPQSFLLQRVLWY